MENIIQNKKTQVSKKEYDRPGYFKFIQYSGHDTTLYSLFSGLLLHSYTLKNPNLGSAFAFELHRESNGDLNVKCFFRLGPSLIDSKKEMEFEAVDMTPIGCTVGGNKFSCPYEKFKTFAIFFFFFVFIV